MWATLARIGAAVQDREQQLDDVLADLAKVAVVVPTNGDGSQRPSSSGEVVEARALVGTGEAESWATLAVAALERAAAAETKCRQLEEALLSRDVIGQAKGILMERHKLTPDGAFDLLRDASQHLNVKLRDVAAKLAEMGEMPTA